VRWLTKKPAPLACRQITREEPVYPCALVRRIGGFVTALITVPVITIVVIVVRTLRPDVAPTLEPPTVAALAAAPPMPSEEVKQ
jgi:hypothetical protein